MATATKQKKGSKAAKSTKTENATKANTNAKEVSVDTLKRNQRKIYDIDPRRLTTDGFNIRKRFANSNEEWEGFKQRMIEDLQSIDPLLITHNNGQLIVRRGHRRLKAINELIEEGYNIISIPCYFRDQSKFPKEEIYYDQLTSNSGLPYTTMETAWVVRELLNLGHKQTDIAKRLGKSQPQISSLEQITRLPLKIQSYLQEDRIAWTAVLSVIRDTGFDDEDTLIEVVEKAIELADWESASRAKNHHIKAAFQTISEENERFDDGQAGNEEEGNPLAGYDDSSSPEDQAAEQAVNKKEQVKKTKEEEKTKREDKRQSSQDQKSEKTRESSKAKKAEYINVLKKFARAYLDQNDDNLLEACQDAQEILDKEKVDY